MLNYFNNSILDKSFNYYHIYLANDKISNREGVEYFNTKLSPVIIQNLKSFLAVYPTKNYEERRYIDKNTILRVTGAERNYYRENTIDTYTDESTNENIKFLLAKSMRLTIEPTKFPSKFEYHEIITDTFEYTIGETITVFIRNDSKVYIQIKKDDYIDTTIDSVMELIRKITDSVGN